MNNKSTGPLGAGNSLRERLTTRNLSDFSSATIRRLSLTRIGRKS